MAENQGANGDAWNNCAVALLKLFGWDYIGDKNMDLPGSDDNDYGVDALVCYDSPSKNVLQSCVIESKRYSVDSLTSSTKLKSWIERLRTKLDALYQSEELIQEFPRLEECCSINLGIIICWVHDAKDTEYFNTTFSKQLERAVINTQAKQNSYKRIYVLTNPRIVRLCSIASVIKDGTYNFVYPSQLLNGRPLVRSKVLSIEYAVSNIIYAERDKDCKKSSIVFYFGKVDLVNMSILKDSLKMYNLIESGKELIIYHYENDESTRTILPDVKKKFKGADDIDVKFKTLEHYDIMQEPAILKNCDDE